MNYFIELFAMIQCQIWDELRDLLPFTQFKKHEKHPWRSVTFSKQALACNFIQVTFCRCFSRFLYCTNGTQSRNASDMYQLFTTVKYPGFFSEPFRSNIPLTPDFHENIDNKTNLQLNATGFCKYVWPFSGHHALKEYSPYVFQILESVDIKGMLAGNKVME